MSGILSDIYKMIDRSEDEARQAIGSVDIKELSVEEALFAGKISERLGELDIAITSYNHVLEKQENNIDALRALAAIRTDQGDWQRARMLLSRLKQQGDESATKQLEELLELFSQGHGRDGRAVESEELGEQSEQCISDADVIALLELFSGRQAVHARQWCSPDGRSGYSPVRQALTPAIFRQHLSGLITVGVYVVRRDNTCCFIAFDLDIDSDARRQIKDSRDFKRYLLATFSVARRIRKELLDVGIVGVLESSGGKGHHVWAFFKEPLNAGMVRSFGLKIMASLGPLPDGVSAEVFPVQAKVKPGGLGSLIKLPLGVHQRSGRRSMLLDTDGRALSDEVGILLSMERVEKRQFEQITESMSDYPDIIPLRKDEGEHDVDGDDTSSLDRSSLSRERFVPTEPPYYLDEDAELVFLLERCSTLRKLMSHARANNALSHDEQSVIIYTLGHLERGASAVNEIFIAAGHPPPLKSPLRGHPTSCRKIRAKLGIRASDEQCKCAFDPTLGSYEHPMLHLAALRAEKNLERGREVSIDDEERLRLDREIARLRSLRMRLDAENKGQSTGTNGVGTLELKADAKSSADVIPFPTKGTKKDEH